MTAPETGSETDEVDDRRENAPPVVGIGASAGGIHALRELVPAIPTSCGLAFVIVQHLDPDHESKLAEILRRMTAIPVVEIENDTFIEQDHIYVIPQNVTLTIEGDHLHLSTPAEPRGLRMPIDSFFTSLATSKGENAACVILSGTGSDGTLGLRAIKHGGGLTVAQAGAQYDGMMRSAVSTGLVDVILPASEIPTKVCDYFRHAIRIDEKIRPVALRKGPIDYLAQICSLLRTRTGHDFTGYKDKTVSRRVQRRMQVLQIEEIDAFIDRLRQDPRELDLLLQDLLIGVTNFFRDPAAFEALEREVIPHLFDGKGPDDTIRVWIPGCSTGEEAFSIAMLLREQMPKGEMHGAPKLQIFASDIDEHSLQTARIGRFPATIAKDIPARLFNRYFVQEDGTCRVTSDLREICLFSSHNLLRDAPFSKLDLISCRNLLIYLTPDLQNRLIPLFHYALNDSGYLFLGTSENVTRHSRLFSTADKAHRIFKRRPQIERRLPEFPLTTPDGTKRSISTAARSSVEQESLQSLAERQVLDRYSPAYVVINGDGDVLQTSGRTGKYLELPAGAPKLDIFSMARRGLRLDLRAAVHRVVISGQITTQRNIVIGTNGGRQTINLIVQPLRVASPHEAVYLVIFQDVGTIEVSAEGKAPDAVEELDNANLNQLEAELRATKERLQTTTEELESSNEELKSGNEELSSMNEELQSTNEELETSKEELQSINEELQTVNAELNARVEDLSRANSDIANLLESTQIATVFLDLNLAVKSFTPAAKDVFRLVESDTGRPITHVRARFSSDTVQEDAERVLRTLATIEHQVESSYSDARYIMRMMPYRTVDNVIGGVVLTFVDITKIMAAEARISELGHDLRNRVQSLETLLNMLPVGILIMEDNQTSQVRVNRYGAQLLGEAQDDEPGGGSRLVSTKLHMFKADQELAPPEQPLQQAARSGQPVADFEGQVMRRDGARVDVMMSASPLFDDNGTARGGIAAIVNISERKRSEAHQDVLLFELQHRVKNIVATISALATRMLKNTTSLQSFSTDFLGRLRAMAATHELLSRQNWTGASLQELIATAIGSHLPSRSPQIRLTGPDLTLSPNAAATLGMVFYELATNAIKYGSLSVGKGRVDISWVVDTGQEGAQVGLRWFESDGPIVSAPDNKGLGAGFVSRSVAYELQGEANMQFHETGFQCDLRFPLRRNVQTRHVSGMEDAKNAEHPK